MFSLPDQPHHLVVSQPQNISSSLLPRLSQDSLHRLELNSQQSIAVTKATRVRNWIHSLSVNTAIVGNSVVDFSLHHDVPHTPLNMPSRSSAEFVQSINNINMSINGPLDTNNMNKDERFLRSRTTTSHTQASFRQDQTTERQAVGNGRNTLPGSQLYRDAVPFWHGRRSQSPQQPPRKKVSTDKDKRSKKEPPVLNMKSTTPIVPDMSLSEPATQVTSTSTLDDGRLTRSQRHEVFKSSIQDVFPDICEEYIKTLYAKHRLQKLEFAIQDTLDYILTQPSYPKNGNQNKRKREADTVDESDLKKIQKSKTFYYSIALDLLEKEYALSKSTIFGTLIKHKTYFETYLALHQSNQPQSDANEFWEESNKTLKIYPTKYVDVLEHEWLQVKKVIADREAAKKKEEEEKQEKNNEEEHRIAGTLIECQCCFSDVPLNRTVSCEGDQMHMFCNFCIKKGAETQVGLMKYELKCFDVSGCQAAFNSEMFKKAVGDKLMKRLEDLQQMDEISKASIIGLEECPFCEFKAICPPIEQDREFTCLNPGCRKISCRFCKEETHIPQTCKEAKKERGIPERRVVEEAMTTALIRSCPKCRLPIIKIDGCNQLKCKCGSLICDVCKQNITRKGYGHFHGDGACPSHESDTGRQRRMDEVMEAERVAMATILSKNGNIDTELLQVSSKPRSANMQRKASVKAQA